MRKSKLIMGAALAAALLFSSVSALPVAAVAEETADAPYEVQIAEENNLAANKWDWLTDKTGSAEVAIDEGGLRMENFNKGGSGFAVYQTNKFSEFKYSMYANLNLTIPSECGLTDYDFDYSNLYISFMIKADSPSASYACPWNGSKAYFSLCFENLQGHPKTILYVNESWAGKGEVRYSVAETDKAKWNDGKHHWFEFEFVNDEREEEYRGEKQLFTGKTFKFYFDGELAIEYFQREDKVFSKALNQYVDDLKFTATSGYLGYWTTSDFPLGYNTSTTNCYVQIDKVQITSLDGETPETYKKCAVPEFEIESLTYSPAASYDTGEDIEIKLVNLFEYEGEEPLTYTATSGGKALGKIQNGFWLWTPEEAGTYYVDIKAEAGGKSAMNYLTLRVVEAAEPVPPTSSSDSASEAQSNADGGCNSSIAASAVFSLTAMLAAAALASKKRKG